MLFPIKDYNPTQRVAYVTILLIVINVAVFLYQGVFSSDPFYGHKYGMIPWEISHLKSMGEAPVLVKDSLSTFRYRVEREVSPLISLFTSMFMHGTIWHLLGNMLFLWIFGNNIEDYLGRARFILFYLLCGIGASLAHVLFHLNSPVPVIGASGAVSGIMGAYLVLYPGARVRTLVFVLFFITFVDIPAFVFLIVWLVFQFFYAASAGSGIAWLAHVGGFFIGLFLVKRLRKKYKPVIEIIQ